MAVPLLEQVKIQAQVLVPLVRALQPELGEERADALSSGGFQRSLAVDDRARAVMDSRTVDGPDRRRRRYFGVSTRSTSSRSLPASVAYPTRGVAR